MEKIAIIGISCLFPDAQTPGEFWQNLLTGKFSISAPTTTQIGVDPEIFYDPEAKGRTGETGEYYCNNGGYIKNFKFDPTGYRIAPEILEQLDDIYQWPLYVAKQALLDSGYFDNTEVLAKCGVILGNLSSGTKLSHRLIDPIYYQTIESAVQELLQQPNFKLERLPGSEDVLLLNMLTAGYPSAVVAQALSLAGINFSLDAACASSLYAVELACQYLRSGKANLMLAGAVSATDPLCAHTTFSIFQAYPDDGISRPLDRSSGGLIAGEGAGMLVLKRYSDALRDGDRIYATVLGTGLSNDGKGKHFLSPNPKGQLLAFERAYATAGIAPDSIDYVECHATGTPLGDRTELDSMETWFGKYSKTPLIGSVKSNLGHLLTAAGMPSMLKVILSMSHGLIPPTINVRESLASTNKLLSRDNIVTSITSWPSVQPLPQRAAVSAFGFGGTNSHLILEGSSQSSETATPQPEINSPLKTDKMAIVGMDAFFGQADNLDAFEKYIYQGIQPLVPVPSRRWKGIEDQPQLLEQYGFPGAAPLGAYISDFDLDYFHYKIIPDEADQPIPQQLLILKVADRALQDAGIKAGANVAVIVAMNTDLSSHVMRGRCDITWQVKQSLAKANINLPPDKILKLENILRDSYLKPPQANKTLSMIGNVMASRISALWDFPGPTFTLSAEENSVFKALEVAQLLMSDSQLEAVLVGAVDLAGGVEQVLLHQQIAKVNTGVPTLSFDQNANGPTIGEGAGAVVLKSLAQAQHDQERIYAVIDAISLVQEQVTTANKTELPLPLQSEAVKKACQQAWSEAGIAPSEIGYLEVYGSGIPQEDEAEKKGLFAAYQRQDSELSCGIGSIKTNIGHTYAASGMASLIKTALCLYHQYIPATPRWTGPKQPEHWQGSPFYVPTQSTTWFVNPLATRRVAAINGLGIDRTYAHVILSEDPQQRDRRNRYLEQTPFYLFPLAGTDRSDLLEQLQTLQKKLAESSSLTAAASRVHQAWRQQETAPYALAIVGRNQEELQREIQRALQGIPPALEQQGAWKTPLGSYFTAQPQGQQGGVAFVYPGAFTSYVGMGQDVYHLFPQTLDQLADFTAGPAIKQLVYAASQKIYPRSPKKLSRRQLEALEMELLSDASSMLISGIVCASGLTKILQDYFRVEPKAAFGYSLGEVSMMFAQQVWTSGEEIAGKLQSLPLFATRLAGPMNAVREYWGLPPASEPMGKDFWSTYVVASPVAEVQQCLQQQERVYLLNINTPEEVVIAGDTQSCRRVIKQLECSYFPAPFSNVIHCEVMRSEYEELVRWFSLPTQKVSGVKFYSAANYTTTNLETGAIAQNLAQGLCQLLDFPRLVNQIYQDGARIFIEVGPGSTCSRWISETLGQQKHLAVPLDARGRDDQTTIVQALAQLVSHRVPLDLTPLYRESETFQHQKPSLVKQVTLGGCRINSTILTPANRQDFAPTPVFTNNGLRLSKPLPQLIRPELAAATIAEPLPFSSAASPPAVTKQEKLTQQASQPTAAANKNSARVSVQKTSGQQAIATYGGTPLTRQLTTNHSQALENHTIFLNTRQQALQQMSELIQLQIALGRKMLTAKEKFSNGDGEALRRSTSENKTEDLKVTAYAPTNQSSSLPTSSSAKALFEEAELVEFAQGKISKVFGSAYADIDTYPKRVRLPMPPYMFVSRVTKLEAQRGCFEPCSIETEYDIPLDAWYVYAGQVPSAIFLEASHASMFLLSYLGIDLQTKGRRVYRVLGGTIESLADKPPAGTTMRCHVQINSFLKHQDSLLYFFTASYFKGNQKFLELQASGGMFSDKELQTGQGITLTKLEQQLRSKITKQHFTPLLRCDKVTFTNQDLLQLCHGNLAACFGDHYDQQGKNPSLVLPPPPILMIDRVLSIDLSGGAWGLGLIVGEKTLDPQQWYFQCHFKNDLCLPGTLISEAASQLMAFYMLYLGMQTRTHNATIQALHHQKTLSRNRAQVTPTTGKLTYQVEITEIGLEPTPFIKGEFTAMFQGKIICDAKNFGFYLSEKSRP